MKTNKLEKARRFQALRLDNHFETESDQKSNFRFFCGDLRMSNGMESHEGSWPDASGQLPGTIESVEEVSPPRQSESRRASSVGERCSSLFMMASRSAGGLASAGTVNPTNKTPIPIQLIRMVPPNSLACLGRLEACLLRLSATARVCVDSCWLTGFQYTQSG